MSNHNVLIHYGILGMKWGVRRFQNKDGSLTKAGKKRYAKALNEIKSRKDPEDIHEASFRNLVKDDPKYKERLITRLSKVGKQYPKDDLMGKAILDAVKDLEQDKVTPLVWHAFSIASPYWQDEDTYESVVEEYYRRSSQYR